MIAYEIWSVCGEAALSFLDTGNVLGACWARRETGHPTLPAATVGCVHGPR